MADDLAQQILSSAPGDNSIKALAWDAFNQAKDANDLAMRLKVLGLPNSVKADLWDAKAGHYTPNPTAGLAGVAKPQNPIPMQDSGLERAAQSAGLPATLGGPEDIPAGLKAFFTPEASKTSPGFGQTLPIVGPLFRAQRETYDQPGAYGKIYGSIPILGPIGYRMGQQLESGDQAGAAGSGANIIMQILGARGTKLPANVGTMAETAGQALETAAPYAGKAAGAGVTGAGLYKTVTTGNPEYLLSALAKGAAGGVTEGTVAGTGSALQRLAAILKTDAPQTATARTFLRSPGIEGEAPASPSSFVSKKTGNAPTFTPQERIGGIELRMQQLRQELEAAPPEKQAEINSVLAREQSLLNDLKSPGGLPNATYLRDDIRSQSQQPPVQKPDLLSGIREHQFLSRVQDELNQQTGSGADIVDARMAQYAKSPVDVGGTRAQVGKAITQAVSQAKPGQVIRVPKIGPFPESQIENVTGSSNLADLLTRSIQMARARK